jgi:hypothetical protein
LKKPRSTAKVIKCGLCWNEQSKDEFAEEVDLPSKVVLENLNLCNKHKEEMENNMQHEFPKSNSAFLKTSMFQDQELPMTFLGWDKKANEDRVKDGKTVSTWKDSLKYCLRYSYPEMAKDEAGELRLDKNGQPFKNSNYDPKYPHGYTIVYHFAEGDLETGSLPLFNAFCAVRPSPNEVVLIYKTGTDKETKWRVRRASGDFVQNHPKDDLPEIQLEAGSDEDSTPF